MNKRFWTLMAVLGMTALVVTLVAVGLQWTAFGGAYSSNGERIYFTATNDRGERITSRGGSPFGGSMMGSQYACVSCHGQDASGGVHLMMMQVMDAPDIRWSALAGEVEGEQQAGDEHDDEHAEAHAEYDLETFRLAVVEGKHPNGERLSNDMPRWNVSDDDLADLATFLNSPSFLEEKENELFPGNLFGGDWWIIFPIIGIIVMFIFMLLMFIRRYSWSYRRDTRRDYGESGGTETALDILKKRFARGEITKEEYESMLDDIQR